jgi:hypothetical protein
MPAMLASLRRACGPLVLAGLLAAAAALSADGRKFYDDDPIAREPATQDASRAEPWEIDLFFDLAYNLFARPGADEPRVRARNVNTIDEVPDSSWFTNRIYARALSIEEIARGPNTIDGPARGQWTIIRPKAAGTAPGFVMQDAKGEVWFVSLDGRGYPEAATGATIVATRLFWALGYNQVESYLVTFRPEDLVIGESAHFTPPSGRRRAMRRSDIDAVLARAARLPDGSYRAVAGRAVPGKILNGFKFYGTRPDDPNDIVPHQHRRELRALKVFGAWTNLVDMKAGNTLDTVVTENGRGIVRHYLQDVGSTFGVGALGPHDWDEGFEHFYEGGPLLKRLVSLGFYLRPWQTARYEEHRAVGRFEGDVFDAETWKTHAPVASLLCARDDDTFWAALRVTAFTDEMIRAAVKTGQYSDPAAEKHLVDVLIKRRDKIARTYLPRLNPIVNPALDAAGTMTFENAAVKAGVAPEPAGGYRAAWFTFDNGTGATAPIGAPTTGHRGRLEAPPGLPAAAGAYIKVDVSAVDPLVPTWKEPVSLYFRRVGPGWKLVGLERLP